jgi:monovalent cation:H+ antiporter-2, CPA2 family
MEDGALLLHLITALGAALVGAAIASRLRLPLIVGYVLAGVAIGPFTPGIVGEIDAISQVAELGIVLLMFVIGAQLSLRDLTASSRITIVGALVQVAVIITIGYLVGRLLGWSHPTAYAFGAVLSNSSSTVLGKILTDRGELDSRHAQLALGWSSVQDLSSVLLVAAFALSAPTVDVAGQMGRAALFFVVLVPLSFWAIPWLLRQASAMRSRELFTLAVVTIALAMAGSAAALGISLALGAFLAGIVIGESDLAHRVLGDAIPLRDIFSGAFFVAIGMLLDPGFVVEAWPLVLLTVVLIVVVKGTVTAGLARWLGAPVRLSVLLGAALAQSGEFSFLMARIGLEQGALTPEVFNLLLSATIVTILLSPGVNALAPILLRRAGSSEHTRPESHVSQRKQGVPAALHGHAVVCGYGRVGSIVCTLLERQGKPFVVVDEDQRSIATLRARGIPAVLGDAGVVQVLERAEIRAARLLVLCIPERMAVRRALDHAREVNPTITILARTHSYEDRAFLETRGVDEAVLGEMELALELGRRALERFDIPVVASEASIADLRNATDR